MKEITYKIRQIFMSTRVIENPVKYRVLCLGCSLIHFVFMVTMFIGEVYLLSAFNLLTTLLYAILGFVLSAKEKYKELFLMAFVEVELNSVASSILLGSGYDFMIYTLALIPGAFYLAHTWPAETKNKYGVSVIPMVSTIIVGALYVIVDIMYSIIPPSFTGKKITAMKPYLHYFDIMSAVLLLLAFSILFALEVRYMMRLLGDENLRLGEIAAKDPLTKAYNRRSMNDIINREIDSESNTEFCLIMLDIDDFKKVNDTYGHGVGDQVLIKVASIMQENIRDEDYLCRWGGEEFLLMIHGTEEEYAFAAERIRKSISEVVFDAPGKKFSVTATLGISVYQTGLKLRTLVDMADQKLYYGKSHGKNQVVK